MKGKIKISVKGLGIRVKGYMYDANIVGKAAVVDALMNAIGLVGESHKTACDALLYVDDCRAKNIAKEYDKEMSL